MKIFILFGVLFVCHAFMMMQCSAKAFIGGLLSGIFGESLHRYRYDLETGTSFYQRSDGTIDSWQSPQKREFRPNSYHIQESNKVVIPRKHLEYLTNLFLR